MDEKQKDDASDTLYSTQDKTPPVMAREVRDYHAVVDDDEDVPPLNLSATSRESRINPSKTQISVNAGLSFTVRRVGRKTVRGSVRAGCAVIQNRDAVAALASYPLVAYGWKMFSTGETDVEKQLGAVLMAVGGILFFYKECLQRGPLLSLFGKSPDQIAEAKIKALDASMTQRVE